MREWWNNPPLAPPKPTLALAVLVTNVILASSLALMSLLSAAMLTRTIEGHFGWDATKGFWLGKSLQLMWALMIPLGVRLARWYGHKLIYVIGMLLVVSGSALALMAHTYAWMIFARIFTGAGSGVIFALGVDIIIQHCPKKWRGLSLLIFSNVSFGVGVGGGLLLGGWLAQIAQWRAIFYFDLLAYSLMGIITVLVQTETKRIDDPPFHWVGYLCSVVWLTAWLVLVAEAKRSWNTLGWTSPMSITLFGVGLAAFVVMIIHGRTHDNPLFMPRLFRDPAYSIGTLGMLVVGLMVFGVVFVSVGILQDVFRYEPLRTGMLLSTIGFIYFFIGFIPSLFKRWIPMEWFILPGLACVAISCWMSQRITIQSSPEDLLRIFGLRAVGIGLVIGPLTVLALSHVPERLAHKGSTVLQYMRLIVAAFGSSIVIAIKNTRAPFHALRYGEMVDQQSAAFRDYTTELADSLIARGLTPAEAMDQARGQVIGRIVDQAELAGVIDAIYILGWAVVAMMVAIAALQVWIHLRRRRDDPTVLVPSR